jgi:hypothetical protein
MGGAKKAGRPPFEPTKEQRDRVEAMVGFGIPEEAIAKHIGVSGPTLRKHFRTEIDTGATKMLTSVAGALYRNAMKGNVTAQIFIMKTRGGWSEKQQVELSGAVNTSLDGQFAEILRARSEQSKSYGEAKKGTQSD